MLRNCQDYFSSFTDEETEAQASVLINLLALKDERGKASFFDAGLA